MAWDLTYQKELTCIWHHGLDTYLAGVRISDVTFLSYKLLMTSAVVATTPDREEKPLECWLLASSDTTSRETY